MLETVCKEISVAATAKLFINGRSQAVRIPKDLAFEGINEVSVREVGN